MGIPVNAKLRAQHLKVIAHTEITSVSKIKQPPKILTSGMFIMIHSVPCSGKSVPVSHYRSSLSKRGGVRDKHFCLVIMRRVSSFSGVAADPLEAPRGPQVEKL